MEKFRDLELPILGIHCGECPAKLPEGAVVPIEFTPETVGEFGFQCQMGMFRGRLIVE